MVRKILAQPNDVGDLIRSSFQFAKLVDLTSRLNHSKNGVIDRNGHIETYSRPAGLGRPTEIEISNGKCVYSMHVPYASFTRTDDQCTVGVWVDAM